MKLHCIFDKLPEHDRAVTGDWHYLNLPSGHVIFVCHPRHYDEAEKHLRDLGGKVFPEAESHEKLPGEIHKHAALEGSGVTEQHTSYQALKMLAKHFGWAALDPRR